MARSRSLVVLALVLSATSPLARSQRGDARCRAFDRGTVCPLTIDNVLEIDSTSMKSAEECQYSCYRDKLCNHFTFFRKDGNEKKCVLFAECETRSECRSCFTGPAEPSMDECRRKSPLVATTTEDPTSGTEVDTTQTETTAGATRFDGPLTTTGRDREETTPRPATTDPRVPKQFDDDDEEEDEDSENDIEDDGDTDEFEVEGVDEGLLEEDPDSEPEVATRSPAATTTVPSLDGQGEFDDPDDEEDVEGMEDEDEEAFPDDYFDEDSDPDSDAETVQPRPPRRFNCMMGGYGPNGPVNRVVPVVPTLISRPVQMTPLPAQFPLGTQGCQSSMVNGKLFMCSPGAQRGAFAFFGGRLVGPALQPGGCYAYSAPLRAWEPVGSPMNTYRGGSAISRMGRFFVASGGRRFPKALNSIEVLNTRNPNRWRTLSKLTLPNPTYDHCSVALNKTAMLVTGGFGQESQNVILDLKGKKWHAQAPMKQPRRKHSCIKARVNGRDGVIVAGGESDAAPALASLEFFDMAQGKWLNLGRMRQGRRFPGVMALRGNLIVAGGENTNAFGQTNLMDSMEILRGRNWRPVRQRLPQPRSRFAMARIPRSFFF